MPDLPAFHGWTHRPKAQGGTDPTAVDSPIIWATRGSATANVTTPWTLNGIVPTNSAGMGTNDLNNQYFEEIQDSNGVNGIRIIQEGFFALRLKLNVFFDVTITTTSTRMVPPYLRADMIKNWDIGSDPFTMPDAPNASALSVTHLTSAPAYMPDDADLSTLNGDNKLELSAVAFLNHRDLGSGSAILPLDFAWCVYAFGGTENFRYNGGIELYRLDDARVAESQ